MQRQGVDLTPELWVRSVYITTRRFTDTKVARQAAPRSHRQLVRSQGREGRRRTTTTAAVRWSTAAAVRSTTAGRIWRASTTAAAAIRATTAAIRCTPTAAAGREAATAGRVPTAAGRIPSAGPRSGWIRCPCSSQILDIKGCVCRAQSHAQEYHRGSLSLSGTSSIRLGLGLSILLCSDRADGLMLHMINDDMLYSLFTGSWL